MQLKVKCLLVDDLEENLLALTALLRRDDVELLTARSGAEALELLLTHDVALALLDVHMPEMDGFELAELMRGSERTRHVPIIFVTAGARDQHRQFKGYELGAVDFLYKPVEPHILQSKADIFFQLSRQKQLLAQELKERTETLRLNEMFTAVLGHDLRNPLNAILMSAQYLQRRPEGDARARETADRIVSSGTRMRRMIDDMLDLARARLAGGIPLKREQVDLAALVERVVREHATAFPSRRIEVQHDGDLRGDWDGDRLAQVASNLIGNALEHGAAAPVIVRLEGASPNCVVLSVTNHGVIPPAILPHIFDPFRGGARQTGQDEGLGLGLYIVQQILQSHGGGIEVDCSDAQCTTFRVTMPRSAP